VFMYCNLEVYMCMCVCVCMLMGGCVYKSVSMCMFCVSVDGSVYTCVRMSM